jgi:anti-anti-sigma regulatory factor
VVVCHPASDDALLRITRLPGQAALAIAGEIDDYTHAALVDALQVLTDGLREIHINLAGLEYCDIAGLRAIVLLAGGNADHGHEGTHLVLHEVPAYLRTVLQILGWDTTPGLAIGEPGQRSEPALAS